MVRNFFKFATAPILSAALLAGLCQMSVGQDYLLGAPGSAPPVASAGSGATLFQNVRIFDGKSAALTDPSNVLVSGNTIDRISAGPISVEPNANVQLISGNGRVLMPGLID